MSSEPKPSTSTAKFLSFCIEEAADWASLFKDKTAYVFGGAGKIGVALCKALLNHGLSKLAILDLNELPPDIRTELQECNPSAVIISEKCDIADKKAVEDMMAGPVYGKVGNPDLVVHSTNITKERDLARCINVNLVGPINSSILAMNRMSRENEGGKGGIIVNVASIAGLDPTPVMSVLSTSKSGLVGFTRSMAHDITFNRTGVKFMLICPAMTGVRLTGDDLLFDVQERDMDQVRSIYPAQSPNYVGDCLIEALKDGENGAVWISMDCQNSKKKMPESMLVNRA